MALLKLVVLFAMVGLLRAECLQGDEDCVPASDNSTDASTSASRERRDNHLPELQADQYSENEESIAGRQAYLPPPPPPPPPPMYAPPPPIKCYMVCPTENIMLPVPPTTPPPPPPPPTYAPPTAAPYMYPTLPPPTPAPYMYPTTTAPPPYMYPTTTTPPPYFYPTTTLAPPAYYPPPVTTPRPY